MTATKVKWGIIGLGRIAHKFASDLLLSEQGHLTAVASRSADRAKAFSAEFQSERWFSSYRDLCESDEVDVVYIATPHSSHFEHTMMCLENGKAVLCEKPMGLSLKEVEQMVDAAREKNLFLMEAMWTRFIPAIEKVLEWIDDGKIGELISIRADFGFRTQYNPESRHFNKGLGGGSLMDIGIYPVYLTLLLLGLPDHVRAMSRSSASGVDTFCAMLFDYKGQQKAILESSLESNTPTEAFIYGTEGHIKIHRRFHQPNKVSLYSEKGLVETLEIPFTGNGYLHEIEDVNRCLLKGENESEKHPLQMSLDLIFILDRVKAEIGLEFTENSNFS